MHTNLQTGDTDRERVPRRVCFYLLQNVQQRSARDRRKCSYVDTRFLQGADPVGLGCRKSQCRHFVHNEWRHVKSWNEKGESDIGLIYLFKRLSSIKLEWHLGLKSTAKTAESCFRKLIQDRSQHAETFYFKIVLSYLINLLYRETQFHNSPTNIH